MALASDQGHQGGGKLLLFRLQTDYAFPGKSPLRETRAFRCGARAHVFLTLLAKLLCVGVSLEDWGRACRLGEEVQQEGKNRRLTEIYAPFERYAGEILS